MSQGKIVLDYSGSDKIILRNKSLDIDHMTRK